MDSSPVRRGHKSPIFSYVCFVYYFHIVFLLYALLYCEAPDSCSTFLVCMFKCWDSLYICAYPIEIHCLLFQKIFFCF